MSKQDPQVKKRLYTQLMDVYRHNDIYIPGFNTLARTMLRLKAESHVDLISKKRVHDLEGFDDWLQSKNLFFGYGLFRSGTTFLANFLNRYAQDAVVQHEANVNDYWFYAKAIHSATNAEKYVKDYRLAEIYFRTIELNYSTYGEINPFLRRHCKAMSSVLPNARQFQIVRDPKNVLRSLMSRELLGKKDPMNTVIFPAKNDPFAEKWGEISRFEKLCWLWAEDNRFIRENVKHAVTFEKIRSDFDYFQQNILQFLNLKVNADDWKAEMEIVFNSTPRYTFPKYAEWSQEQKQQFDRICGQEMSHYGY